MAIIEKMTEGDKITFVLHTHSKICTENTMYYKNKFSLIATLIFFHKYLFFSQTHSGLHDFRRRVMHVTRSCFMTKKLGHNSNCPVW